MGGTLNVQSTLGVGTTFIIELPAALEIPESGAKAESPIIYEGNFAKTQRDQLERETPEHTTLEHQVDPEKPEPEYSVLCIEDNPSNLRLLEVILQDRPDIRLLSAIQGSIGLELARRHEPDLILLDLHLPDIHGKEVLARLQQSALTRDIPVVVVSADATPNQMQRLLTAGSSAYLTKPLNVPEFLQTLDKFLPHDAGNRHTTQQQ